MEDLKITMVALQEAFATRMAAFESELKNSCSQSPTVASLAMEFDNFRSFSNESAIDSFETIKQQVTALAGEIDAIEMRSRHNTLLLHGLPEAKDEQPTKTFFNAATKHLSGLKLSSDMMSRTVRLGQQKQDKPRPLLVKFFSEAVRNSLWFAKSGFKGTGRIIAVGSDGKRHVIASIRDIDKLKPCSLSNSFGAHSDKTSATDWPVSSALGTKSKRVTSAKRNNAHILLQKVTNKKIPICDFRKGIVDLFCIQKNTAVANGRPKRLKHKLVKKEGKFQLLGDHALNVTRTLYRVKEENRLKTK
ncbi:hypothetical protein ACJJTC_008237 [Scirpophaga incertulas]